MYADIHILYIVCIINVHTCVHKCAYMYIYVDTYYYVLYFQSDLQWLSQKCIDRDMYDVYQCVHMVLCDPV